jgi:hypothetical protein
MEDANLARGYLAEALAQAGRGAEAEVVLKAVWPGTDAPPGPLLLRARALAREPEGDEAVRIGLLAALEAARAAGNAYEVGVCLDLLCALPVTADTRGWTADRDDVLARFGVRRLAPPPWAAHLDHR